MLLVAERRRRITEAQVVRFVSLLRELTINVDFELDAPLGELVDLADDPGL